MHTLHLHIYIYMYSLKGESLGGKEWDEKCSPPLPIPYPPTSLHEHEYAPTTD